MPAPADLITLSVPRTVLTEVCTLSDDLTDRMHHLLELNTDGRLPPPETTELEHLVSIAQFGQIVTAALKVPA